MTHLVVIHYPVFGGPHNRALRLKGPLEARGWSTVVAVPSEGGAAARRLREALVDVVELPLHRLRSSADPKIHFRYALGFFVDVSRLRRVIRESRIDVVVIGGLMNPQAAIAAALEGVPAIWQVVDSRTPSAIVTLFRPMVRRLGAGIMFGGYSLRALHGMESKSGRDLVCSPPVDTRSFRQSPERRETTRRQFGVAADTVVVGTVANVNPQKGIEWFIRAARCLAENQRRMEFWIVGASYDTHRAYEHGLREEARSLGLSDDRLRWFGERSDLEMIYPALDVKVITSVPRSEGTTTTAMEAMACGVPVVATDVGAVRDVVIDGVTGILVTPCNADSIADGVTRLLGNHAMRSAIVRAGRALVMAEHDTEVCADRYRRMFEDVVHDAKGRKHPSEAAVR